MDSFNIQFGNVGRNEIVIVAIFLIHINLSENNSESDPTVEMTWCETANTQREINQRQFNKVVYAASRPLNSSTARSRERTSLN
jgi:hypothetical protein